MTTPITLQLPETRRLWMIKTKIKPRYYDQWDALDMLIAEQIKRYHGSSVVSQITARINYLVDRHLPLKRYNII